MPPILEVIKQTRATKEKYKVSWPKVKLYWVKSYDNKLTGVVRGYKTGGKVVFYAKDLFDCYGPFKSLETADTFLKNVIHRYDRAIRQAEVLSWREEGSNFLKPVNVLN